VRNVAYSPDGKLLASISADNIVTLWDVATHQQNSQLVGHIGKVNSIAFSPNGKLLASGSDDKTTILWDIAAHNILNKFRGHTDAITIVAFSPDGKLLATASNDKTILLWKVPEPLSEGLPKPIGRLAGQTDQVINIAFSPDGKQLAATSTDKTVIFWDLKEQAAALQVPVETIQPTQTAQLNQNGRPIKTYSNLVVGFSQIGAESDWRTANTASMKETAKELGVTLKFHDMQSKQETQINGIRMFIADRVDVIAVAPVITSGYETVFKEAKAAGIPIILIDRHVDGLEDYYVSYLGSDFTEEGRKAGQVLAELVNGKANIVELTGTPGSGVALERERGFRKTLQSYPSIKIIDSRTGDFTRVEGKQVMKAFLKTYGKTINALYAHNDEMAIGAIEAIEEYGLKPGVDIKIVSIDATRSAFEAMVEGKLNATIECNPLMGPQFYKLALKVANGEDVPRWVKTNEGIFYPYDAAEILPTRKY
jgi:simple sugar transport system substrate-binding protein